MGLVKWIRKNERKLMAALLVLIMIAFVGGVALQEVLKRLGKGSQVVARFGADGEIGQRDLFEARDDLKVLRLLGMDRLMLLRQSLLRTPDSLFRTPDFKSRLLGQLLFPDPQTAALVSDEMKRAIVQNRYLLSNRDIDEFFSAAGSRSELFWILLTEEARQAGCVISDDVAKERLKYLVPQITENQVSAAQMVDYIINNHRIAEDRIVRTFGNLLAVLSYANLMTSSEDVTLAQIRSGIGRRGESIDAEFVKIDANVLAADQVEPTEEELSELFGMHKGSLPDDISRRNPYGFGYKLEARVQVEYLIARVDDIRDTVERPSAEATEEFYRRNAEVPEYGGIFKYSFQTDPNDPESTIEKTRNYAAVASKIRDVMIEEKTNSKADMIFNEAKEVTEAGYSGVDMREATSEQLGGLAGDYGDAASKLSAKHDVKVYAGKTGMLTRREIAGDSYLGMLAAQGQSMMPASLGKIVFAIDELSVTVLGRFDVSPPKMWENIGPMRDRSGGIVAMVRVVRAQQDLEPAGLDTSFSIKGAVLDEADDEPAVYSVREKVVADCKVLSAMRQAREWSDELVRLLEDKTWGEAIDEFNELHETKEGDESVFVPLRLEKISGQSRASLEEIKEIEMLSLENPIAADYVKAMVTNKALNDKLYSIFVPGHTEVLDAKRVLSFRPGASYYIIKDIFRTTVTNEEYYNSKVARAYQIDAIRSDNLAFIHFSPENIFKRMNYSPEDQPDSDSGSDGDDAEKAGGGAA